MIERFDIRCDPGNPVREQFRIHHLNLYLAAAREIGPVEDGVERTIVDAASGLGHGYPFLSSLGSYIGLERDDGALAKSRSRYASGDFRFCDLDTRNAFRGVRPDVVVSLETAEHLDQPEEFLRRAALALPVGGLFIFSVPTCLTRDFDPFHRWDWSIPQWNARLREAGFEIARSQTFLVSGSFRDFIGAVPTSRWQKIRVALFNVTHPRYLASRLWNWIGRNRFEWTSTLFVCRKVESWTPSPITTRSETASLGPSVPSC